MFKLMIADDNPHFLTELSECIDWEIFDCELIGAYENGKELLDAASENIPDLVITDVSMPIMDGFELSSQLYRLKPSITIIFISGYSEFQYAHKALQLGIFDYIVKPLSNSNLLQCMDKAQQKLHKEQLIQFEQSNNRSQQNRIRKTALSHYVGRLLFYAADDAQIQNSLSQLGYFCSPSAQHYVACYSIDHSTNTDSSCSGGKTIVDFLQFLLESNNKDIQIVPALAEKDSGAFLLSCSNPAVSACDLFSKLCVDAEAHLNLRICIGYAGPCNHFADLPKLYTQAKNVHSNLSQTAPIVPIASSHDIPLDPVGEIKADQKLSSSYSPNVAKMREYIEQHYTSHITTLDVARHVFLSAGYANICFTNECGISIFNYIVQMRIKKASQLLTETKIPIASIAEKVGYSNKTSFYLAFKRYTGTSPTDFRLQKD